jgi:hypothetical protein
MVGACDNPNPDPPTPKASTEHCREEGAIWGPCRSDATPPAGCDAGLTCLTAGYHPDERGICTPYGTYGEEVCASPESLACAAEIGDVVVVAGSGMCGIPCGEQCGGGTVCTAGWPAMCLWPGAPGQDPPVMTTGDPSTTATTTSATGTTGAPESTSWTSTWTTTGWGTTTGG